MIGLVGIPDPGDTTVLQYGDLVRYLEDFRHAVRYVDNGNALIGEFSDNTEEVTGFTDRER